MFGCAWTARLDLPAPQVGQGGTSLDVLAIDHDVAIQDQYGVLKIGPQGQFEGPRARDVGSNNRLNIVAGGSAVRQIRPPSRWL